MDYNGRYALTENGTFQRRLQMALWIAAVDVLNEDAGTTNHTARATWAGKALKGPQDSDVLRRVSIRCSANASIGAAGEQASDSDIQFVVNSLVDELA